MKFYQVLAAILIWRLLGEVYNRTLGFDAPTAHVVVALLIWALVSALIWVLARIVFRAIDGREEPSQ